MSVLQVQPYVSFTSSTSCLFAQIRPETFLQIRTDAFLQVRPYVSFTSSTLYIFNIFDLIPFYKSDQMPLFTS